MRLAIALSILAQSLPVASKKENTVNSVLPIENNESPNDVRKRLLLNEDSSSVRVFGQRAMRERQQASTNSDVANTHGSLRNMMTTKDECNPTTNEADVGVLACGVGRYCMASDASSLGGYCVDDETMELDRQLQGTDDGVLISIGMYYDGCAGGSSFLAYNGTQVISYCFNVTSTGKSFCIGGEFNITVGSKCLIDVDGVECNSCYFATDYRDDPSSTKCTGPIADAIALYDHFVFDCENAGAGSGEYSCVDDIPGSEDIAMDCNTTLAVLAAF